MNLVIVVIYSIVEALDKGLSLEVHDKIFIFLSNPPSQGNILTNLVICDAVETVGKCLLAEVM